jgi:hypothetical protein
MFALNCNILSCCLSGNYHSVLKGRTSGLCNSLCQLGIGLYVAVMQNIVFVSLLIRPCFSPFDFEDM